MSPNSREQIFSSIRANIPTERVEHPQIPAFNRPDVDLKVSFERHLEEVLPRLIVPLADGLGNLVRLAETDPDVPGLVAHDDERREREAPAALDDLGDAVDVDDALLELLLIQLIESHDSSLQLREGRLREVRGSELETGLAGGNMWLVPASGATPTVLTPPRRKITFDMGDFNAWQLSSGLYVDGVGACATLVIGRQHIDKAEPENGDDRHAYERSRPYQGMKVLVEARIHFGQ